MGSCAMLCGHCYPAALSKVDSASTNSAMDAIALPNKGVFLLLAAENGIKASAARKLYNAVLAQQHQ